MSFIINFVQVIDWCSDNSPLFVIEYVFLKIRGKSVGEKIKLNLTCPDDGKTTVEAEVNLEDISVQMTVDHTNQIQITDTVKLKFSTSGEGFTDITDALNLLFFFDL